MPSACASLPQQPRRHIRTPMHSVLQARVDARIFVTSLLTVRLENRFHIGVICRAVHAAGQRPTSVRDLPESPKLERRAARMPALRRGTVFVRVASNALAQFANGQFWSKSRATCTSRNLRPQDKESVAA